MRCGPTTRRPGSTRTASIGDTPKIFTIDVDGNADKVVGAGCKNGGFYILRADNGKIVKHTPIYTGPPTHPPAQHDPRVLALPSPIGGLQSGCATDGRTIFTNGIDAVRLGTQTSPSQSGHSANRWTRHRDVDRPGDRTLAARTAQDPEMGGTPGKPMYRDVGDIVASGIAVGNGVAYFTAVASGKLVALDAATGSCAQGDRARAGLCRAVTLSGTGLCRRRKHACLPQRTMNASSPSRVPAASVALVCRGKRNLLNFGAGIVSDAEQQRFAHTSQLLARASEGRFCGDVKGHLPRALFMKAGSNGS